MNAALKEGKWEGTVNRLRKNASNWSREWCLRRDAML
jgi:hypothetical protein